jgi:hypothetical protein
MNNENNKTPTTKRTSSGRPTAAVTPISYRKISDSTNKLTEDFGKTNIIEAKMEKCKMIDDLLAIENLNGLSTKMDENSVPSTAFSSRQNSVRAKNMKVESEDGQNNFPQLQLVARQLSLEEIENVWKTLALSR